jgi:hypothetical protein
MAFEKRAAWLGLTKHDYIQRHILSDKPVQITPALLRRQIRWLAKNLERMEAQVTVEERRPDVFRHWFGRFWEVFDITPPEYQTMEHRYQQFFREQVGSRHRRRQAPIPGSDTKTDNG